MFRSGAACAVQGLEVKELVHVGTWELGLAGQCWALMSQAKWWFGLDHRVWTHNLSLFGRTPGDVWCCLPPEPPTTPHPRQSQAPSLSLPRQGGSHHWPRPSFLPPYLVCIAIPRVEEPH